jgi:hypothetical protein
LLAAVAAAAEARRVLMAVTVKRRTFTAPVAAAAEAEAAMQLTPLAAQAAPATIPLTAALLGEPELCHLRGAVALVELPQLAPNGVLVLAAQAAAGERGVAQALQLWFF